MRVVSMPLTAPTDPEQEKPRPRRGIWAWILRRLSVFVFGQTKKGEPIPERVYFHTTYPDKRLPEDQWFKMLGIKKRRKK